MSAKREERGPVRARRGLLGRGSVIASPYLWLLFFFLVPFVIVLKISVAEVQLAIPPYTPLFAWPEGGSFELFAVGDNYRLLIEDSLYIRKPTPTASRSRRSRRRSRCWWASPSPTPWPARPAPGRRAW